MIAIAGIILGIGIGIDDKRLKEFGRTELYNAFISAAIVGSLIGIFTPGGLIYNLESGMVSNITTISCSGVYTYNVAICFANQFLVGINPMIINGQSIPTIMGSILSLLAPLTSIYATLSAISSISVDIVIISINLSMLLQPILGQINYAIEALTFSMLSIEVQSIIMQFVAATAFSILMPIGLILRSFFFTRRLGGAILAITIALFAVLPMTYLLDAQLINNYSTNAQSTAQYILSNSTSIQSNLNGVIINKNIGKAALLSAESYISGFLVWAESVMINIWTMIAGVIVEAFILPIFSLILTIISARDLARIMGSEISFSRFDIL